MRSRKPASNRRTPVSGRTSETGIGAYWDSHEFVPKSARRRSKNKGNRVYHVLPRPGTGWQVKAEKSIRPASTHRTKRDAVARAREVATRQRSEVVIHRRDGCIQERQTYGLHPLPPRESTSVKTAIKKVRHFVEVEPELMRKAIQVARAKGITTKKVIGGWIKEGAKRD